jgi:hypothetical protein
MYFIQLMLTKNCNQNCYYCTTHANNPKREEVDIDFLKYVLDCCPNETGVELTGGEIGLIDNLDEVYKTVKDHKNIMHIKALSNGLIRQQGVDWLNEVEYWEHLIHDIKNKEITKFYDLDLDQDHTYVIVTTQYATLSLLNYWDYFEEMGLFKPNFFYKLMNHKSQVDIKLYFDELCDLYSKLNNVYFQRMLIHYYSKKRFSHTIYNEKKALCSKYPPNIYVDFQDKILGHCAMNVNLSHKEPFNKENLHNMMEGKYIGAKYCDLCYSFDNGKNRSILNNRSYEQ